MLAEPTEDWQATRNGFSEFQHGGILLIQTHCELQGEEGVKLSMNMM